MNNVESRSFRTPELASILGESIHKTISYVNRGYVKPSVQDAKGHGSKRLWSYMDIVRCMLVQRLLLSGFSVDRVRDLSAGMDDENILPDRVWLIRGSWPKAEGKEKKRLDSSKDYVKSGIGTITVDKENFSVLKLKDENLKVIPLGLEEDFKGMPDIYVVSLKVLHALVQFRINCISEETSPEEIEEPVQESIPKNYGIDRAKRRSR